MEPGNQNQNHTGRRAALGLGVLGLALAGVVVTGALPRLRHGAEMNAEAQQALQTDPSVNVVVPTTATGSSLLLPGNIQAAEETVVYARTSGYLRRRLVDIGAKVVAGQLLAEIESPEVDQQLRQAQAETLKSEAGTGQALADTARLKASVAQAISDAARLRANLEKASSEKIRAEAKLAEVEASASNARAQLALARQNVEGKKADLQQAQAHQDIADKTSLRWQGLARQGAVSQQDADERLATFLVSKASVRSYESGILSAQAQVEAAQQSVNAAQSQIAGAKADIRTSEQDIQAARSALASGEANVQAARESVNAGRQNIAASQAGTLSSQANVQRVGVLKSFEQVTAPFAGVITSRNVDTGALINAGSTGDASGATSKSGLFGLARIDTLRIRVNVPQSSVLAVHPGQAAKVLVQEFPGREFVGTVTRIAGAMDSSSRTLVTEVTLPNRDGKLIPGMYAQVKFDLPHVVSVRLPASTLLSGTEGTRIALISKGNKVHYTPVKVGRDFGSEVEILTGVTAGDQVVVSPSAALKEGTTVHPIALPAPDHK
ncbi:MAG: family efflux transporter, subunit [Chthonomonadaceae bacterium]|nr:family efflux transporter, subunit [Chthonomonadaceae bacterium]